MLPAEAREDAAEAVRDALLLQADGSPLDNDKLLGLLRPTELVKLGLEIRQRVLPNLSENVRSISENVSRDESPHDAFSDLTSYLDELDKLHARDDEALALIIGAREEIENEISEITSSRPEFEDGDFEAPSPRAIAERIVERSVFEDVDE